MVVLLREVLDRGDVERVARGAEDPDRADRGRVRAAPVRGDEDGQDVHRPELHDLQRHRLARELRSGMVEMNGNSRGAGAPFGGVKASGRAREGGVWGIEEFLEVKAITGWDSESRS